MKYQNIIDNMTLKEKAAFLSGKSEWQTRDFPRLDIPAIFCSDGPNGVRKQAGAGDHLGINNLNDSIESFARSCYNFALEAKQDLWVAPKESITK